MMKKTMLYLLLLLSVLLLAACQKQPQPEIKLPEPQAAASPAQPEQADKNYQTTTPLSYITEKFRANMKFMRPPT